MYISTYILVLRLIYVGGKVLDEGYSQTNQFCTKIMICINFGRG